MENLARPPCHVTGTAFITGGGSGIGKFIASTYAQNGIEGLALADINITNLQNVQAELSNLYPDVRVEVFSVNVTEEKQIAAIIQSAAAKFGRIDISIHAAGITGAVAPTHEYPLEDWQRVINTNQTGVMLCDKWMIRQMLTQELRAGYEGRGMIVNVASIAGVSAPDGRIGAAAYVASKHAVVGLTKLDAKIYANQGIRINAICPGYVVTPLIRQELESHALSFEIEKTSLKRAAEAEEIANAVLFLTSRMGSYMCANTFVVDGGYTA
ncbi:hypothetical protein PENFLA_c051G10230 [Penicillium flavigenum]|uniref:Uncharacterized protein n=1 Tax=Penicillium flavigenum TaxID=254877 RepID=A0A1V6SGW7_9EURO|nr:hypothetical protein PENFLA_c051G10230 [Penicillium flavigenum]